MSDITQMTSAELALKFYRADSTVRDFEFDEEANLAEWKRRLEDYGTELDRRCTDAGIFSNGNGTFKLEPRFNMTVKEANEWLALSQYMVSKIKNER